MLAVDPPTAPSPISLQQELATYPPRKAQSQTPHRVVFLTQTGDPSAVAQHQEGTPPPPLLYDDVVIIIIIQQGGLAEYRDTTTKKGYRPPQLGVTWI